MDSMAVWNIAYGAIWVVGILTAGGIILFRPLIKQLGEYLELLSEEMRGGPPRLPEGRVLELLEGFDARLSRLEEDQDFHRQLTASAEDVASLPGR